MQKQSANALLNEAAQTVDGRRSSYGEPRAFFAGLAARWFLTLGRTITPSEVVLCMIELKLARLAHDPRHRDSIRDLAGYAAILREIA